MIFLFKKQLQELYLNDYDEHHIVWAKKVLMNFVSLELRGTYIS